MALTMFQQQRYMYRADLYQPTTITTQADADAAADAVADSGYLTAPAYTSVPCRFASAAEVSQTTPAGLLSEANIFVFFNFYFDAQGPGALLENTWVIQLKKPGHPNDGNWFYVMDNPKTEASFGLVITNESSVFTRRGSAPNLL